MADKAELVREMKKVADRAVSRAATLTAADWSEPVYQNGWNVKQMYCHIASTSSIISRLIERAKSPPPPAPASQQAAVDVDAWNAKHVLLRQDKSTDEIVAEIKSTYASGAALIESTPDSVLAVKVYAPNSKGEVPLSDRLMHMLVRHNSTHLDEIDKAVAKN